MSDQQLGYLSLLRHYERQHTDLKRQQHDNRAHAYFEAEQKIADERRKLHDDPATLWGGDVGLALAKLVAHSQRTGDETLQDLLMQLELEMHSQMLSVQRGIDELKQKIIEQAKEMEDERNLVSGHLSQEDRDMIDGSVDGVDGRGATRRRSPPRSPLPSSSSRPLSRDTTNHNNDDDVNESKKCHNVSTSARPRPPTTSAERQQVPRNFFSFGIQQQNNTTMSPQALAAAKLTSSLHAFPVLLAEALWRELKCETVNIFVKGKDNVSNLLYSTPGGRLRDENDFRRLHRAVETAVFTHQVAVCAWDSAAKAASSSQQQQQASSAAAAAAGSGLPPVQQQQQQEQQQQNNSFPAASFNSASAAAGMVDYYDQPSLLLQQQQQQHPQSYVVWPVVRVVTSEEASREKRTSAATTNNKASSSVSQEEQTATARNSKPKSFASSSSPADNNKNSHKASSSTRSTQQKNNKSGQQQQQQPSSSSSTSKITNMLAGDEADEDTRKHHGGAHYRTIAAIECINKKVSSYTAPGADSEKLQFSRADEAIIASAAKLLAACFDSYPQSMAPSDDYRSHHLTASIARTAAQNVRDLPGETPAVMIPSAVNAIDSACLSVLAPVKLFRGPSAAVFKPQVGHATSKHVPSSAPGLKTVRDVRNLTIDSFTHDGNLRSLEASISYLDSMWKAAFADNVGMHEECRSQSTKIRDLSFICSQVEECFATARKMNTMEETRAFLRTAELSLKSGSRALLGSAMKLALENEINADDDHNEKLLQGKNNNNNNKRNQQQQQQNKSSSYSSSPPSLSSSARRRNVNQQQHHQQKQEQINISDMHIDGPESVRHYTVDPATKRMQMEAIENSIRSLTSEPHQNSNNARSSSKSGHRWMRHH